MHGPPSTGDPGAPAPGDETGEGTEEKSKPGDFHKGYLMRCYQQEKAEDGATGGDAPTAPEGVPANIDHAVLWKPIPEVNIDAILTFFDKSVQVGAILGHGQGNSTNGRLNALRTMLEVARDLKNIGDTHAACHLLEAALIRLDGETPPPDWVEGSAVQELYAMTTTVMEQLGDVGRCAKKCRKAGNRRACMRDCRKELR
jgi:hypothetical protein